MRRSCGDDSVDQLTELITDIHSVTSVLTASESKSICILIKDADQFDLGRSTPEACECAVSIREALKKYRLIKFEKIKLRDVK